MNALEIIARLYSLLGECGSSELSQAAAIADSSHLGNALAELAKIKRTIEGKQHEVQRPKTIRATVQVVEGKSKPIRNGVEARVDRIVLDPTILKSNADVADFLSSLGLEVLFRGKDGRKMMLERLKDVLNSLDSDSRKRVLGKLFAILPKSETMGWFEAIRGDLE